MGEENETWRFRQSTVGAFRRITAQNVEARSRAERAAERIVAASEGEAARLPSRFLYTFRDDFLFCVARPAAALAPLLAVMDRYRRDLADRAPALSRAVPARPRPGFLHRPVAGRAAPCCTTQYRDLPARAHARRAGRNVARQPRRSGFDASRIRLRLDGIGSRPRARAVHDRGHRTSRRLP